MPRTLDFIPGWQWRLLNRGVTGSEICFRKVIVTASYCGAGKEVECCTPTCRGRAAWRNTLPAPFPAARAPTRRARNSSYPSWTRPLGPRLGRLGPRVTSALTQGLLEPRGANRTFAPAPRGCSRWLLLSGPRGFAPPSARF